MTEETNTYNHTDIESKWQKKWEESESFKTDLTDNKKEKYYCLEMFPYPSGEGLHIGHTLNYTIGDIFARYKRMNGYNVLYPMGYDAFGLPAENAAIKAGEHPKSYTEKAIKNFIEQQKALGLSYDWSKMLASCYPEYYKWNQYFFLKFLEKGLVYRDKAPVNWCPKCQTVLANEQAQGGKCWRHEDTDVEIRHLEQWFIKTTAYTEELLEEIENLEWPERIKSMQRNWIGKSEGSEIIFEINNEKIPVFTTRPDTLFGATFMVISAQHPRLMEFVSEDKKTEVKDFVKRINSVSQEEIEKLDKEGVFTGSYAINPINNEKIPVYAGNFVLAEYGSGMVMAVPAHDQRDFDFAKKYGIEIREVVRQKPEEENVFGVGALIQSSEEGKFIFQKRDNNAEFSPGKTAVFGGQVEKGETSLEAIKRELKEELGIEVSDEQIEFLCSVDSKRKKGKQNNYFYVKDVDKDKLNLTEGEEIIVSDLDEILENPDAGPFVEPVVKAFLEKKEKAYTGPGKLVNSGKFDELDNEEAKTKITEYLAEKGLAKKTVQYKFRDWLVSRQRYWGTPIPVIYCDKCGIVPVPENELPVILPDDVNFGEGKPLSTNEDFVNTKCPECGSKAKRETDTMDTFVDSSWYFLRYLDNNNSEKPFEKNKADYWMPIDQYIGGAEHACLHLIYARFWTKALRDLGFVDVDEPFKRLFNQGMLHASDGKKMSKSLGNVINPLDIIKTHGADSLRLTLMSFASPDSDTNWDGKVLEGANKFLKKVYNKISDMEFTEKSSPRIESKLNKTIKQVTDDINNFRNNLAIIKIRALFNSFKDQESREIIESFLKLLHPICPHITEELWEKIGNKEFISIQEWPKSDESKIDEKYEQQEQQIEKLIDDINNVKNLIEEKQSKEVRKSVIYVIPDEKPVYEESFDEIKKRTALDIEILSVNEPEVKSGNKDPEGKSKKVKPGKPGIYLE